MSIANPQTTSIPSSSPSTIASSSSTYKTSLQPNSNTTSGSKSTINPSTPLRPITSPSGFVFPAIWSFPPFFTLQPNPQTLAHQLNLWTQLVLNWARFERVWRVDVDGVEPGELFNNRSIQRKLLTPSLKQLMIHMMGLGHVAPDPPKQSSVYLIYWRKPEEWGNIIYDWITDTGQIGSILTFYELTEGELSETTEFRNIDVALLRRSIDSLVKKGKAQIIKGDSSGSGDGVRFL